MTPERTSEGKRVLYLIATGQRFERWPVDAGTMLLSGAYTADPSLCQMAAATVSPAPEPVPVPPGPTEHSPGVPLVITQSTDAAPAKPFVAPTGQTSRGRGRAK